MKESYEIIICDDDASYLECMRDRVDKTMKEKGCVYEAVSFNSCLEMMEYCKTHTADFIIADIKLPGKSSVKGVEELQNLRPESSIVFVSMNERLAIQVYKYKPYHYVRKRCLNDLEYTLSKLIEKRRRQSELKKTVRIRAEKGFVDVDVQRVIYLRSDRNYVIAYDEEDNEILRFRGRMKNVYPQLSGAAFIHTNRSYILNCRFIKQFGKKKILMRNNKEINGTRNTEVIDQATKIFMGYLHDTIPV